MALVFVPTPLGNLRDITLRALDTLRECALVVAEDTRVARKLLSALELPGKEIWNYHEHNARSATPGILERARTELVAVVTDAGMPGISDPGSDLAAAARAQGIPIEVLPGASAALGAAVLSGFNLRRFFFEGFLPKGGTARRKALERSLAVRPASIWYESPQRVRATLADIAAVAPEARVFLLREYTKLHEQQVLGTAQEVLEALPDPVRGEVTLVFEGRGPTAEAALPADLGERIEAMLGGGEPLGAIARTLADSGYGSRNEIYARAAERQRAQRDGEKARR